MKELLLPLLHLAVMAAKLCGPGGVRAVIAENLLLKQYFGRVFTRSCHGLHPLNEWALRQSRYGSTRISRSSELTSAVVKLICLAHASRSGAGQKVLHH